MPTYRVLNPAQSGGDGTGDGSDWTTNAIGSLEDAVENHATADGDIVLVHDSHVDALSADTTIIASKRIAVICVDKDVSDSTLATGAVIGSQTLNYSITLNSTGGGVYYRGLTFQTGTNTSSTKFISIAGADDSHLEMELCTFNLNASGASGSSIMLGSTTTSLNTYARLVDCVVKFSNTAQEFVVRNSTTGLVDCSISASGQAPAEVFGSGNASTNCRIVAEGCDFSHSTSGTLIGDFAGLGKGEFVFVNCLLGSSMTKYATQTVTLNKGGIAAWFYNCSGGDNHYEFAHYDPFGSTVAQPTVYANDGAKFDGTNPVAWQVTSSPDCGFYTPYVSPWIDKYAATGSVTPTLECLRNNSGGDVWDTNEVWADFSYQGTSNSTRATIVPAGRMTPLGTPAGQTSSSITWMNATGTPGKFKLSPGSVTVNEIGHLRARVVVGEPSITVYVDPTIRT
jgi:hypothetical protein